MKKKKERKTKKKKKKKKKKQKKKKKKKKKWFVLRTVNLFRPLNIRDFSACEKLLYVFLHGRKFGKHCATVMNQLLKNVSEVLVI